jgi:hypothetical protein
MTLWQDQTSRRDRSGVASSATSAPQDGRPLSRREARERERQAAEALAEGRVHPSGVYDFDRHDLGANSSPEQDFGVHDTADIWAALSRQSGAPAVDRLRAAEPGIPSAGTASAADLAARGGAPATPSTGLPPVTDDLMDRVRSAVLGRDRTADAPAAPERPLTRRDMRGQRGAENVDALPASWFPEPTAARPVAPAAFTGYVEEPTVAMPAVDRATLDAQEPVTAVVDLPHFFPEPVGDDEVHFSAPLRAEVAEPLAAYPEAEADASFLEPEAPAFFDPRRQAERFFAPQPEQPVRQQAFEPAPFTEPRAETTDVPTSLAGFEALISRARNKPEPAQAPQPARQPQPLEQPQPQAPAAFQQPARQPQQPVQRPATQWMEDQPDEPAGFSGLLSRTVGTSSGSQNALILPRDPQPDFTQAINGSGDIFITGTHRLDASIGATGAHKEHIDSADIDRLYEAAHDEPAHGVSPVRASRAVSGGMTGRSPLSRRSHSAALPTVLAVVAGLMAVGVIVMLVGSWVLRLF